LSAVVVPGRGLRLPLAGGFPGLKQTSHFRFRRVAGKVLLTSDTGQFVLLSEGEFEALVAGTLSADEPIHQALAAQGFLASADSEEETLRRYQQRKSFLGVGPYLHVFIVTLRCNQTCLYCHASRRPMQATEFDMSRETADQAVRVALQSPAPSLTLEFQGGEPLANFDVVKFVVERALELNAAAHKSLAFSLVTNLSLMDDEKLAFILDHGIQVCTSLDGPEDLHNANRPWSHGNSHAETVRWMERINQGYADRGHDPSLYHVEALLTVTRDSLPRARDIVDEYVRRGLKAIFARPLNPFGFATRSADRVGYGAAEFLKFHRELLDYVVELSSKGTEILERLATIFLVKILTEEDPNYLDIRSPCGAGVGQIAYNHDGQVFCCDEGRMLHQMGDSLFRIGDLKDDGYGDLVESEVVRSIALASCLEGLPGCSECAYLPYCGTCPVFNYSTQGNIFGRMPDNQKCQIHMGVMDHLFELLASGGETIRDEVFGRWVESRERPFFMHEL
jgi:His-Xaa-Ser system radical SAM maturase HxsB